MQDRKSRFLRAEMRKRRHIISRLMRFTSIIVACGLLSGAWAFLLQRLLMHHFGYEDHLEVAVLIALGILAGAWFFFQEYLTAWVGTYVLKKRLAFLRSLINVIVLTVSFLILRYCPGNSLAAFVFVGVLLAAFIYTFFDVIDHFFRNEVVNRAFAVLAGMLGGVSGGLVIGFLYGIRTRFSIDEGLFVLQSVILSVLGCVLGFFTVLFRTSFEGPRSGEKKPRLDVDNVIRLLSALAVVIYLAVISWVCLHAYWGVHFLNSDPCSLENVGEDSIFHYFSSNLPAKPEESERSGEDLISKEEIIAYLEEKPKTTDMLANLYLLSGDRRWAEEFREVMMDAAASKARLSEDESMKAWQYEAMVHAYYYLQMRERLPDLFSAEENEILLEWFRTINEEAYARNWADYVYSLLLKRMPDGLYENQEIGVEPLAVLNEVLRDAYPKLVERNERYISRHAVGWKGNFRSPDDGIVYHQTVRIKNAFVPAKHAFDSDIEQDSNARNSFEWVLAQWPPNGISPAYNVLEEYTPFDVMTLGAYLFSSCEYKLLVQKMLLEEMDNREREIDYLVGLQFWDVTPEASKPGKGSCYIEGTTGLAQHPGPLRPDKVVLREGWDDDSLYGLFNLRFSGWHSYKATNSLITLIYGVPFVVEDLYMKEHKALPLGKSDNRDKKICREELNAFQKKANGFEKVVACLVGMGSYWRQDPPQFATVSFYGASGSMPLDYIKTELVGWNGWGHERTALMLKNRSLEVFDHARGESRNEVGVTWQLQGDAQVGSQDIRLEQEGYSLGVFYPHREEWFDVLVERNESPFPPGGRVHDCDYRLTYSSRDADEVSFATVFMPLKGDGIGRVTAVDVLDEGARPAYPKAKAVAVEDARGKTVIGTSGGGRTYDYRALKTDSEMFACSLEEGRCSVCFVNGGRFSLSSESAPQRITLNGNDLEENSDWSSEREG